MMKTGIVGPAIRRRRRWAGQIIWMLFSSHCYTKCGGGGGGGGGGVSQSVGPSSDHVDDIPSQVGTNSQSIFGRSPKEFLPLSLFLAAMHDTTG